MSAGGGLREGGKRSGRENEKNEKKRNMLERGAENETQTRSPLLLPSPLLSPKIPKTQKDNENVPVMTPVTRLLLSGYSPPKCTKLFCTPGPPPAISIVARRIRGEEGGRAKRRRPVVTVRWERTEQARGPARSRMKPRRRGVAKLTELAMAKVSLTCWPVRPAPPRDVGAVRRLVLKEDQP